MDILSGVCQKCAACCRDNKCKDLGKDNLCKIYPNRPQECKDYPFPKGNGIPTCGYKMER
jgi:hypothetical protein